MQNFGPDVQLDRVAYIHPSVQIYGKVTLGEGVSVWPNTIIRSEMFEVEVGPFTNLQDFVMVHVGDRTPTRIGAYCSITHHCTIHGATIGDQCLIGINATVMDGCVVGNNCIVGGGTFLKEGTVVPDNSVVVGVPGKVIRTRNNWLKCRFNAWLYFQNAQNYREGRHRGWSGEAFEKKAKAEYARLSQEYQRLFPDTEE